MTIDERKTVSTGVIQNLILENRGKLSISGVLDVLSFDDQVVVVETELGLLTVKGENIRINKLSIDTSEVIVEGEISYLAYSDKETEKTKGNLISKINIQDKQNYTIISEQEKKTIYLGDASDLSNKMLHVKAILIEEKGVEGEIFVNQDLNKHNAFFRQKI